MIELKKSIIFDIEQRYFLINKINVKLKQFKFDGEFSQFFSGVKYKSERIADRILSLKVNKEVQYFQVKVTASMNCGIGCHIRKPRR